MTPAAFARLQQTFERDGRLESLPFCALTEKGVEVVSGHHRTRAARAASLPYVFCLVDTTGLSRDQIKAKQLAHNSINGDDNPQILKELYESIEDVDARLEAFIDPKALDLDLESLSSSNVSIDLASRIIQIVFLPSEAALFEQACKEVEKRLSKDVEEVLIADFDQVDRFKQLTKTVSQSLEVKAYGAILGATADIVIEALGGEVDPEERTERVHLAQIVKQAYIPREAAETITRALDKLEKQGDIGPKNRWQGLELICADFLAGNYVAEANAADG